MTPYAHRNVPTFTFTGLWPILDDAQTAADLRRQALNELPSMLEEVGARLTAEPTWRVVPYIDSPHGVALGMTAPAVQWTYKRKTTA